MARDLAPEVERLLQFRDPNIRKKAALCSIRIIKKVPDLSENFINPTASLLKEKHHGVLITAIQLCTDICKLCPEALEYFRKKCTVLVKTLRDAVNSPYTPEYDISGITDPFLHIRLLRLLRVLGQGDADASDCMNDILAQVASKTESSKNAGNAILYECVETIMSIEDNGGLRVLAINILGRFLSNRDNNIRYVALNMLMKAISVDSQAVQRHRATILECVKDSDASIRKRALELVYLLVNETNVELLTKELIEYLEVSDQEFKGDLTAKICSIVEKFSPDKIWYIDQMLKVLSEAGNFVKDEVCHALIVVISNAADLHGYTVRALYRLFQASSEQESLIRVAIWCIGEYGDLLISNIGMLDKEDPVTVTESDALDVVETAMKRHSSDLTTKAMTLIALLKLSSRFPSCSERIREIIIQNKGNFVLELQQRSIEFNSILEKHKNIRSALVERMPVLDEATFSGRKSSSVPTTVSTTATSLKVPNGTAKPAAPLVDLLDLNSDDVPAPSSGGFDFLQDLLGVDVAPSSGPSNANQAMKTGADALLDLLSIGSSPVQNSSAAVDIFSLSQDKTPPVVALDGLSSHSLPPTRAASQHIAGPILDLLDGFSSNSPAPENNRTLPSYPSIVAFESSNLRINFSFSKPDGNPQSTEIQATFSNLSQNVYTDFIFQAAVPKFLQLHLDPASSNTLPAAGADSVNQTLRITNTQHGKKSLVMRIRIAYKVNGKDMLEEGQISHFPPGL
ncbi:hypothetical protein SAY86_016825 [Trapa natans]|uniref:AP-1 complex subunit gamma n=1 Tax=Trapa natans TaxID=22666 RepID=A0AAN7LNA1_TRANT|nr:hypothetical protein SAY86_016825 [Trapa natans]